MNDKIGRGQEYERRAISLRWLFLYPEFFSRLFCVALCPVLRLLNMNRAVLFPFYPSEGEQCSASAFSIYSASLYTV